MPHDRAAVPAQQPASLKIPDQLQQARRPDAPRPAEAPAATRTVQDRATGGILHELKTQRAHD
ncbi:hypothetical protein [Lichenibacterium ramalinae]|uniref:Uncharacterized protein n=1 Tax=Lichenibacterium ramalinae TaxID=2316527 RepID=A0A4Q2RGM0_9HYPH|nr:hypothetical protein [Lichenibacterium ramalinae]RYB07113.1 hypothetical protein D3272_03300 [Lichenibacterium ramalinae]